MPTMTNEQHTALASKIAGMVLLKMFEPFEVLIKQQNEILRAVTDQTAMMTELVQSINHFTAVMEASSMRSQPVAPKAARPALSVVSLTPPPEPT